MARVLIADDSKVVRRMVGLLLRRAGFEVIEAPDGRAALCAAEEREPDVVITDLNMPELGGFELIERLRSLSTFANRPILVLTTKNDADHRRQARLRGATGWIDKPFDEAELLTALYRLLDEPR